MSATGPIGVPAAGTHLLADFWGGRTVVSVEELDALVRSAVASAGATLLELAFHQFPAHGARPGRGDPTAPAEGALPGGITGYALLAESHISVHTWPERGYVSIDVFMCGEQRPEAALDVMRRALAPTRERVRTVQRGIEAEAIETPSPPPRPAPAQPAPSLPVSAFELPASGAPANESPLAVGSK